MNLKWVNHNPDPETICPACAELIGTVWEDGAAPQPPLHPHCYCLLIPTSDPVSHPADVSELSEAAQKTLFYQVVYYLRQGWPIPVFLLPLQEKAEEYIKFHPQEALMSDPATRQQLAAGELHVTLDAAQRDRYAVTLIQAGLNANDWIMPVETLAATLTQFEGLACLLNHSYGNIEKWAGTFENVFIQDDEVKGYLRPNTTLAGRTLAAIITAWLDDKQAGLPVPPIGLSLDLSVRWRFPVNDGDPWICEQILKVWSCDLVLHPAAGGKVERVLNSLQEVTMSQAVETLPTSPTPIPPATSVTPPPAGNDAQLAQLAAQLSALTAQVAQLSQAQADQVVDNPRPTGIYGMLTGMDQVQLAVDALLSGVRPGHGVRPLTGIRELYTLLSGDYEMAGRFYAERVSLAAVTSSTMAQLVANALNKRVMNLYAQYPKWWANAITEEDFNSLQQVRWITLGGVGELPTVTEGQAYTEMTWDDLAQRSSFEKKGGYLGLTMEAIDKDDTRRVQAAPAALAQAAWLTLGKSISNIFTANSGVGPNVYYDDSNQRALFHVSNGNLGSTALSINAWRATKIAMMKLAEVNSGERLGALLRPKLLWVPVDLEDTAVTILGTNDQPGTGNNDVNVDAEGEAREARLANARARVITCPFWTNTANWAAQADPLLYPSIGVGYRYGRTPEIFSVASPTAGLMFTNDVLPVKVRFFFAVGPIDYRGLYKHNV